MSLDRIYRPITAFALDEGAAAASEYALLLAILAGCGVILMHGLGNKIGAVFANVGASLSH